MEKLFKRADGYSEASDGKFAIVPLRRTGISEDFYYFTFKPTFNSQSIRVEWPTESAIAIIPSETATTMVRLNHARNLTKDEVEQYNESVDFDDKDEDEDDEAEAARIAAEELETKRLEAETAENKRRDDEAEAARVAAENKRLEAEAEAARVAAEDKDDEEAEGEDDDTAEGTEKPKRGRKKKETETPAAPIGIPGLTS